MDVGVIPDNADFIGVPAVAVMIMIIIAPKMFITKQKAFNPFIPKQLLAADPNNRMVFFMHHLVSLYIEEPVPSAGLHGDICLYGIDGTPVAVFFIPNGFYNIQFGALNRPDRFECGVITVSLAYSHHELIDYGKNRFNSFHNRIMQLHRVPSE